MKKNKIFQDGCEKYNAKHEATIDENGWNHRCKGIKNRNKGTMVVNIKTINIVFIISTSISFCITIAYFLHTRYIRRLPIWNHFVIYENECIFCIMNFLKSRLSTEHKLINYNWGSETSSFQRHLLHVIIVPLARKI